ncbi:MAG: magnesium-translocating P-type ATPase [Candidatus Ancillula sp.]|jgi:Mg2+-importing ATPase|nr:magnesium-translocating P-type ATPase [Candidatus Ancillula sp.]
MSDVMNGLSHAKVEHLRENHHRNVITPKNRSTVLRRLFQAFVNPFTVMLVVIALVDYFTALFSDDEDWLTIGIIIFMLVASALVSFVQSERSNRATQKLANMISNKVDVVREGKVVEIDIKDVYPGDIVKLSAGDMIPADLKFLQTKDMFVAQAVITGESQPVEKLVDDEAFMGSNVVSGTAFAQVLKTGDDTYIGQIAESISGEKGQTKFDLGVSKVSRLLISFMLIMVPLVLLVNGITKGDWLQALLFAVGVAVGLTPEMLPVIMSGTLAKGALELSKRKVIVKNLSSIQSFGEMDILCTDKTGTLTEDKVVLEKYLNINGEDDDRVLRHAFLNSNFQTGLKNLLDVAVIERANKSGVAQIAQRYTLVDEIPFDFTRRRMSVVLQDQDNKRQLITKGAVEEILEICGHLELNGQVARLDNETKVHALETYSRLSDEGLRVIAVAQKNDLKNASGFTLSDEQDMVLIGFVGFLDPPKESAKAAVQNLREYGVRTVVLTGDSAQVAKTVCLKVGIEAVEDTVITGEKVREASELELKRMVMAYDIFAKLTPADKEKIVNAFSSLGHTVGFMGDGINDAPALRAADVGISVDTAVDIAKETANIILLEKDLNVLIDGVITGRKTFGNIMKYIKLQVSGNFGNMFSVLVASVFLPFLPMLPVQILAQNLLSDFSSLAIPFDNIDEEYVKKPREWEIGSLRSFMIIMGPLSSLFDIICFLVLWNVFGYNGDCDSGNCSPSGSNSAYDFTWAPYFQAGWFIFGTISQILIFYTMRTGKIPFIQSRPSRPVLCTTAIIAGIVCAIGFTPLGAGLDMGQMRLFFIPFLLAMVFGYALLAQVVKYFYKRHYRRWL